GLGPLELTERAVIKTAQVQVPRVADELGKDCERLGTADRGEGLRGELRRAVVLESRLELRDDGRAGGESRIEQRIAAIGVGRAQDGVQQLRSPVARQRRLITLRIRGSWRLGLRNRRFRTLDRDRAGRLLRLLRKRARRRRGEANEKTNGKWKTAPPGSAGVAPVFRRADTPHPLPLSRKGRGESRNRGV